ncbi:MAG: hypothetical protein PHS54_03450 [Clostridia bacterium]|nr:hypothetical protein [Clostridia bacterium]
MINLNELSIGTAEKLRNALKIIIDGYELLPTGTKDFFVAVDKFSRIGLSHTEAFYIFNKIEKEENGALSYKGLENIIKYGKTNTSYNALTSCYKTQHPLIIRNPARLKQLYQEITKKLEPKKLPAEEVSTILKFYNDNLAETAKKISSIYSNSGISKAIEQLEQAITPYKTTLEALNKTRLPLLRENSKLVNSALLEALTSFKQFERITKNINFKTPIFDTDYFKTRPLPALVIKPREAIYIPKNTQAIRENQIAYDISIIRKILQNPTKENANLNIINTNKLANNYILSIKDRELWINNYFLSKPYAVGANKEFIEYVCSKPKNIKIERKNLPSEYNEKSLKEQVKGKSFIKILNQLGFKGEILKAFFPERSQNSLTFRGNKITKEDLKKSGIKTQIYLKELELAHLKNSPE